MAALRLDGTGSSYTSGQFHTIIGQFNYYPLKRASWQASLLVGLKWATFFIKKSRKTLCVGLYNEMAIINVI